MVIQWQRLMLDKDGEVASCFYDLAVIHTENMTLLSWLRISLFSDER
jgi:hypothetical protein